MTRTTLLTLAALLAAAAPAAATDLPMPSSPAVPGPQVGQSAPDFTLKTADGKTVSLADFRGKTLFVNAWATWCPPCREETPAMIASAKSLAGPKVAFLGIDSTEEAGVVRAFTAAKGLPYPTAIDRDRAFSDAYDIREIPTTYVIDPQGIVRARYVNGMTVALAKQMAADAGAGRNVALTSPLQEKILAVLAPDKFTTNGDAAAVLASVKAMSKAIDSADEMMDNSDPAKGEVIDFVRVRTAENALRDHAIAALTPVANDNETRSTLLRVQADRAIAAEQYADAVSRYNDALALDPKNKEALGGLAFAYMEQREFAKAADAQAKLVALDPSASNLVSLGLDYRSAKMQPESRAAFDRAIGAAQSDVQAAPAGSKRVSAIRQLAWAHLYYGRTLAKFGDAPGAKAQFAAATAATLQLPKTNSRYAMYLEQAQEETVAVDLMNVDRSKPSLSLTPWTGPELPGSVPNTVKYRLVVAAQPGKNVNLVAAGLPSGWLGSFCTDKICSPRKVAVMIPESGVKVIEFQVVPGEKKSTTPVMVRVDANDGARSASVGTQVVAAK